MSLFGRRVRSISEQPRGPELFYRIGCGADIPRRSGFRGAVDWPRHCVPPWPYRWHRQDGRPRLRSTGYRSAARPAHPAHSSSSADVRRRRTRDVSAPCQCAHAPAPRASPRRSSARRIWPADADCRSGRRCIALVSLHTGWRPSAIRTIASAQHPRHSRIHPPYHAGHP